MNINLTAYAFADGIIHFGDIEPEGSLPIADGIEVDLREAIRATARIDNGTMIVPGMQEATTANDRVRALAVYHGRVMDTLLDLTTSRWLAETKRLM